MCSCMDMRAYSKGDNMSSDLGIQPVDIKEALEIMDDDDELLRECFEDFLNEMPDYMVNIKLAIESNDGSELEKAAHKLKGSLKYLAANNAAEMAYQLESAGNKNNMDKVEELYKTLGLECERLKTFITHY